MLALLDECRNSLGVCQPLEVVETNLVASPALYGWRQPWLLLPEGLLQNFSYAELRHVFLHELAHVKRRDIAVNWLCTVLQIVHWFNPLVWLAFARMRADREVACDALALSVADAGEHRAYGHTILKLLEGFARPSELPGLVGILEDKNQMKRRIQMIAGGRGIRRSTVLALLLVLGLGAVALTDAQKDAANDNDALTSSTSESKRRISGRVIDAVTKEQKRFRVLQPDGKPATSAVLGFCTKDKGVVLGHAQILYPWWTETRLTDAEGWADLSPTDGAHRVVAVHESGFAEVRINRLHAGPEIVLRPWARIEGTLRIGPNVGANASVGLQAVMKSGYRRYWSLSPEAFIVPTDKEGRFIFEYVPPGEVKIGRMVQSIEGRQAYSSEFSLVITPGETRNVVLGGTGRVVKVRFISSQSKEPLNWDDLEGMVALGRKTPRLPEPPAIVKTNFPALQAWWADFWESEPGLEWLRQQGGYPLHLDPDGTLMNEDVPPDDYSLGVRLFAKQSRPSAGKPLSFWETNVVVPKAELQPDNSPLDLGIIELPIAKQMQANEVAPNFEATTLEGHTFKLSDVRGKVVLLDFWATWCGSCVAQLPKLKAVYEEFHRDDRFVMISLSLDKEVDTVRDFIKKHEVKWKQGFLGAWSNATLRADYGVTGIPALFLIGPDGKLIVTEPPAKILEQAIKKALESLPKEASRGHSRLQERLRNTRFKIVAYDAIPLGEVIKQLRDNSIQQDPHRTGVNFVLSERVNPGKTQNQEFIDPATGLPLRNPTTGLPIKSSKPSQTLRDLPITLDPGLRDVTLEDTLNAIVRDAPQPIDYSMEDYGVVISYKNARASGALQPLLQVGR